MEMASSKINILKGGLSEVAKIEVSTPQITLGDLGLTQVRSRTDNPKQADFTQRASVHLGSRQGAVGKVGTCQVDFRENSTGEVRPGEVGLLETLALEVMLVEAPGRIRHYRVFFNVDSYPLLRSALP